jgi:polyisoprenoid-binding protein YceI
MERNPKHFLIIVIVLAAMSSAILNQNGYAQRSPSTIRFRLDASRSKFIAHGLRGGLLWFKGHEHLLAAREFTGEAQVTPATITPASLQLTVKAESLAETSDAFTDQQKQIINKELREIVFEPDKYPDIVFRSTEVSGKTTTNNSSFDVKIKGDLTLHGVTKRINIPAKLTLTGDELRAVGEFSIDRSDFNVKATSAFHGMVRVRNKVKFTFDIVGQRF